MYGDKCMPECDKSKGLVMSLLSGMCECNNPRKEYHIGAKKCLFECLDNQYRDPNKGFECQCEKGYE
jgi:hypothetical protein